MGRVRQVLKGQFERHLKVTRVTHTDGVPRGWRRLRSLESFAEDADPIHASTWLNDGMHPTPPTTLRRTEEHDVAVLWRGAVLSWVRLRLAATVGLAGIGQGSWRWSFGHRCMAYLCRCSRVCTGMVGLPDAVRRAKPSRGGALAICRDVSTSMHGINAKYASSLALRVIELAERRRMRVAVLEYSDEVCRIARAFRLSIRGVAACTSTSPARNQHGLPHRTLPYISRAPNAHR